MKFNLGDYDLGDLGLGDFDRIPEQWYIFSPTGGTTYRGFTIQFKLVPGELFLLCQTIIKQTW